jgi:putative CRISPR-associated protein (TIGR02619 family)
MGYMISTCGTSMLTNLEKDRRCATPEMSVELLSNKTEQDLKEPEKKYLDDLILRLIDESAGWNIPTAKKWSAELNGLLTYYGDDPTQGKQHLHYFVSSDTYVGKECAGILVNWCENMLHLNSQVHDVHGLNTLNAVSFADAMCDLAKWCVEVVEPVHRNHGFVAFNLTGGFKSVQGFMQTLGMFYADEIFYLFAGSSNLMRIPRLSLGVEAIENGAHDEIERHFDVYRRLSLESATPAELKNISASMFFTDGKDSYLSAWGSIFWEKFKKEFYGSPDIFRRYRSDGGYLPPAPLIFTDEFIDSILREMDAGQFVEINKTLDQLASLLQSTKMPWLGIKAIDFKPAENLPWEPPHLHGQYNYEFDLFPNRNVRWRGLCDFNPSPPMSCKLVGICQAH